MGQSNAKEKCFQPTDVSVIARNSLGGPELSRLSVSQQPEFYGSRLLCDRECIPGCTHCAVPPESAQRSDQWVVFSKPQTVDLRFPSKCAPGSFCRQDAVLVGTDAHRLAFLLPWGHPSGHPSAHPFRHGDRNLHCRKTHRL